MRNRAKRLSVFLVLSLLISCAPKEIVRRPEIVPYEGAVTVDVLKRSVGFRELRTLKALTEVTVYRNGEHAGSFNGVIGYKAPGNLKTAFFGPFGLTVMEFLVSKDLLQVAIPSKNTIYEWQSPDVGFGTLLNDRFRYRMEEEPDGYVLLAYDGERNDQPRARYIFDRTYLLNRSIVFYSEGLEIARIDFDGFNGAVPEQAKVSLPRQSGFEMLLKEPEYDTDIPDEYFLPVDRGEMRVRPVQDLLKRLAPSR